MESDNRERIPYWHWIPAAFALSGIVIFIFASYGPPASSSGFVSTLNGLFAWMAPEYVASKAHYQAIPGPGSWLFTFVLGMAIGGFIAGRTSKKIPVRDMPPIWQQRFGASRVKRYAATFFAGFLILFASRLAGGCTLGLFISGSTPLAISGLYYRVVTLAVAMHTARLIFARSVGREDSQ